MIAIHTYPVWEYKTVDEAMAYTRENFRVVQETYPDKQIIITEAGWATASNGRGIPPPVSTLSLQIYRLILKLANTRL